MSLMDSADMFNSVLWLYPIYNWRSVPESLNDQDANSLALLATNDGIYRIFMNQGLRNMNGNRMTWMGRESKMQWRANIYVNTYIHTNKH